MISGKSLNKRTTKKKKGTVKQKKKKNTKMEMKPENVPDEVLTQAGIVHAHSCSSIHILQTLSEKF